MIKILIADDEPVERQGVRAIITKNFDDIEIVAEAKNGREAIEYAEEYRPDIIFLDIKMPGIDGIQAAREIRNRQKDVKIIILSAYDCFSYAKESLSLDVYDYLLKPVRRKKLIALLSEIKEVIEKEKEDRKEKLRLKENLIGIKSVMQERFISIILEENIKRIKEIVETTHLLEFNFENYFLIGIHIKNITNPTDLRELYDTSYKLLKKRNECILSSYHHILYILIEKFDFEKMDVEENLQEIYLNFRRNKNININYSFVQNQQIENLKGSILKVRKNLSIKAAKNNDYSLIERFKICHEIVHSNEKYLVEFEKIIEIITKKEFEDHTAFYFETLQILNCLQYGAYTEKEKIYFENSIQLVKDKKNSSIIKKSISQEVKNYMDDYKSKNSQIIHAIKEYILKNYHLDLKLEDLSYQFAISSYYLSKLFKQETGANFIEFLTEIRIEKAKKMLLDDIPIKEIYKKIGYSDPNYFSRVFKKITGVSPRNYKG
ncbi:response regulator transcription factor [Crassaminicella profunda]|uniref:response regulator transcription factor n=1 Tax=Crassaminicella profunda TaxID=1286698 RepID=UPI001CA77C65|nr:response regulator [Crassaminicella profunda]QZY55644.1 response regulator [Crassaminicella profunda]